MIEQISYLLAHIGNRDAFESHRVNISKWKSEICEQNRTQRNATVGKDNIIDGSLSVALIMNQVFSYCHHR